ncbi:hypothetical protein [Gryllotalpicola koreensis]|uniref:YfhO family protein n=1 Tax=Gryllotalpicola koreensis TaxID=993086 RepID=A0ABP8A1B7_9MICO
MTSARSQPATDREARLRAALRTIGPLVVIVLFVLLANGVSLLVTNPNPLLQRSGLPTTQAPHTASVGMNSIDPNDGFTTQALGVAAVHQLLSGELPLWNHDEGVGQPLAGGLQSAALFPFTLLMVLPGGVAIFHIVLECLAGIGMYLLLRRLKLSLVPALVGGVLFALNGAFALLANAVVNPIAFLPWVLLGVELARGTTRWARLRGWWLIAIAVALGLYAGFPETAYLYLLLAAGWTLVRIPGTPRPWPYLVATLAGVVLGAILAAPALVAFVDYLPDAFLAGHSGSYSAVALPRVGMFALLAPYLFGPIHGWSGVDASGTIAHIWSNVGGYLSLGTVALALFGVMVRRGHRALQLFLTAWVVVAICRIYGVPVIGRLIDLIPGVAATAAYRYIPAALSAAAVVLAALGLEGLRGAVLRRGLRLWFAAVLAVGTVAFVSAGALVARHLAPGAPGLRLQVLGWGGLAVLVGVGVAVTAVFARVPGAWLGAAVLVVVESVALFLAPQTHAPARPVTIDTGSVTFLKQNLGLGRFFSLGPIQPNYGSYFGIASVNDNNLPVPKTWQAYLQAKLIPTESPVTFNGVSPSGASVTPKQQFLDNLANFESIGVSYVVEPRGLITDAERAKHGLTLAYEDASTQVLRMPAPQSYFVASPGCRVSAHGKDAATVDCASAGSLLRLEQYLPGWHVTVDGRPVHVAADGLFQRIVVSAGRHDVAYRFWPAYLTAAFVAAGVATVLMIVLGVGSPLFARRRAGVTARSRGTRRTAAA